MVNWNRCKLLRACLTSLANQDHDSFEVVVVDNGSRDASVAMVQALARAYPVRLTVIRNSTNRGFCAANNQGFAGARNELIALLNNDAEAAPGWLTGLEAALRRRQDVGMVASKILSWENPTRIDKCAHLIYPDGQNRGRGSGQADTGQFDEIEDALWPDGCAALYRRAMIDEIGGFDEDFFAYADDAELGLRGRVAGWTCLYTPYAVVRHHRGSTLGVGSGRRLTLIERNRILLVAKLFPWSLVCLNVPYTAARVAAGAWATLRGRGEMQHYPGAAGGLRAATALLYGSLSALPLLPKMLRKRRALRPLRRLTPAAIRKLLLDHRIGLRELSDGVIGRPTAAAKLEIS